MQAKQIQLMLSREQSSVVSNWDEHLGLIQISDTVWKIGTFGYEIIGSIYDLVPEDQRYDDDGELVIPESWEGKRIIGLEDGEYLQTDELVAANDIEFTASQLKIAREFCAAQKWAVHPRFEQAWLRIEACVNPSKPLSKLRSLRKMPVIRSGSSASLSGHHLSELAIYSAQSVTELWIWSAEGESECVYSTQTTLSFGEIVRQIAGDDRCGLEIDWSDLEILRMTESKGIVLALACAFDEGAKALSRMLPAIPDSILLPFLDRESLNGNELAGVGDRLLEYAEEHGISVDDVESLRPRQLTDLDALEKSLIGALARTSRRKIQRESGMRNQLTPFKAEIDRLLAAYRRNKPMRYYPGAGRVIPPLGTHSLTVFLTRYVLEHHCLPTGTLHVPYDDKEMAKPTAARFSVDFDALAASL